MGVFSLANVPSSPPSAGLGQHTEACFPPFFRSYQSPAHVVISTRQRAFISHILECRIKSRADCSIPKVNTSLASSQ